MQTWTLWCIGALAVVSLVSMLICAVGGEG